MRLRPKDLVRAGVCRCCLGREVAALKAEYAQRIPDYKPKNCEACGLPRQWTIAPDGVVMAVCLSCVLALLWDQRMQLDGLRKIAQQLSVKDMPVVPRERRFRPMLREAREA